MRQADVFLGRYGSAERLAAARPGPDGAWQLQTDATGALAVRFAGVDHLSQLVRLLVPGDGAPIGIDVRLGPHPWKEDLSDVTLIGGFNDFSFTSGALPMELTQDGTFVLEIETEADTLAYQVLGVAGTRSVNGTTSDRFVYDGDGDYRSVVDVEDGKARIVFDPAKLVRADVEPEVAFRDPGSLPARFVGLVRLLEDRRSAFNARYQEKQEAGATEQELRALVEQYDGSSERAAFEALIADVADPALRAPIVVAYLTSSLLPDTVATRRALAEISPASDVWAANPTALGIVLDRAGGGEVHRGYALRAIQQQKSEFLRADLVMHLLYFAERDGNEVAQQTAYTWLITEYPASYQARIARARFAPDRAIQPGRPIPAFEVASLEDSNVVYSNESLAGRVYLMDFWAVWCGPCIGEMGALHAAYEKYARDGLRILSLSLDDVPDDVAEFRAKGEFPMPWMHAFLSGGFRDEITERFGVVGIPTVILVGTDGTILATSEALRGERLDATLAGVFGRAPDSAGDAGSR